ncbi:MAG: amidase, partial [Rhodospirillales bacterium]
TASSSSTGSGIAVSAGLCSGALGEDTGGSIRGPASATGIVGLRPTYGRVSRHGGIMYVYTNDTIGPMARTVEDCALLLQAIAGYDPKDPLSSERPVPNFTGTLTPDLKGVKLAVAEEMIDNEAVHPDVASAFQAAVEVLKGLGATVEKISLPHVKHAVPLQMLTSDADAAAVVLQKWLRTRWNDFDSATRIRFASGALIPAAVYSMAMRARYIVRRQMLEAFKTYDALLSPTNPAPPAKIEAAREKADSVEESNRKIIMRRIGIYPFSLANGPTIAVPMGFSANGLPLSLQIGARPFAEPTVFRIAHAFERATDWHTRHPDLSKIA